MDRGERRKWNILDGYFDWRRASRGEGIRLTILV